MDPPRGNRKAGKRPRDERLSAPAAIQYGARIAANVDGACQYGCQPIDGHAEHAETKKPEALSEFATTPQMGIYQAFAED